MFHNVSKVVFLVAGARPLHRFRRWFRMAGAALQTCRVASFFASRIVRAASSGDNDNVQIPWQAWLFVTCAEN